MRAPTSLSAATPMPPASASARSSSSDTSISSRPGASSGGAQVILQATGQAVPGQLLAGEQWQRQMHPLEPERAPVAGLGAAGFEQPLGHRLQQAGVLGERQEALRADQAELRVGPADHRRDAERAGPERDLRLIVQEQLARSRARRRSVSSSAPALHPALQLIAAEAAQVAALRLGPIHGAIGLADSSTASPPSLG